MAWVIDLDGVMWLGDDPIPGSSAAVGRLQSAGEQVMFVTNNSSELVVDVEAKLASHGVAATGLVVTSAVAAASMVDPGERVFVCAGPGVVAALEERGAHPITDPTVAEDEGVDVVVVGFTRDFNFDMLAAATLAVRSGARFIGTNSDPTYPTPRGQVPGGGAILAAVATASGVAPELAGKPHPPIVALVRNRLGPDGIMVGDRPDTDGWFATALGYRFGLVASGVTGSDLASVEPPPAVHAADLATMVDMVLGGRAG